LLQLEDYCSDEQSARRVARLFQANILLENAAYEIRQLRAEIGQLRKKAGQRGARMQIMWGWIKRTNKRSFAEHTPEAASWFDADGVPL
jgi:hypothetical protein